MPHPRPSPTRCFLATAGGRVMFDTSTDVGLARELPLEAYRRFQADLRARKERNLKRRAEQLALHDEKSARHRRVGRHASDGRAAVTIRGRRAARGRSDRGADGGGVLASLKDQPRYPLDGAARLQAHLRARHGSQ